MKFLFLNYRMKIFMWYEGNVIFLLKRVFCVNIRIWIFGVKVLLICDMVVRNVLNMISVFLFKNWIVNVKIKIVEK